MGLPRDIRSLAGPVPAELLNKGILGRGIIVSVQQTSVSTGPDFDPAHVCVFTVEVALEGLPRYNATCRQAVRATVLPQLMLPGATVAVRVNPDDHGQLVLSLGEAPPNVIADRPGESGTGSAAWILEHGVPCQAAIVQSQPLGMRSSAGRDMYALVLTVITEGRPPYRTQVGNAVPDNALALVYPGNTVPARRMPGGEDHEIVIDWDRALAAAQQAVA